ncbi:hypothetical protein CKA32_004199 [Geitlerinema sp. FC II]|nr:hypothetical protein CKA32_004199 [Geitlerinema sp. FC II]
MHDWVTAIPTILTYHAYHIMILRSRKKYPKSSDERNVN